MSDQQGTVLPGRGGAATAPPAPQTSVAGAARWSPWRAVVGFGVVSLAADMVYEGARSIYGPLAAPIAVLLWLYLLALAVLIGAAVNAAFDTVIPQKYTTRARLELVQRLRDRIIVRDS